MQNQTKIAVILQCHKNPSQVNRLISRLSMDGMDFYIHVDKKSSIQDRIDRRSNVFFVPDSERVDVLWGDYSQCRATLSLLKNVLRSEKTYDYVWQISGQDYPIKSREEISEFFRNANGAAFLNFFSGSEDLLAGYRKRNEVKYFGCMMGPSISAKILRRLWHYASGGRRHTFRIFRRKSPFEKEYFGSCWWCIPYSCVEQLLHIATRPEIERYYSHVLNPDESMFQTLYMNLAGEKATVRDYLTYVDWSAGGNHPKMFTKEDAPVLLSEKNRFLLARKFDETVDCEILDMIDSVICAE